MFIWNNVIHQFRLFYIQIWRNIQREPFIKQKNVKMEKFGMTWLGGDKYGEYKRTPCYQSIYEIMMSRFTKRMEKWNQK